MGGVVGEVVGLAGWIENKAKIGLNNSDPQTKFLGPPPQGKAKFWNIF